MQRRSSWATHTLSRLWETQGRMNTESYTPANIELTESEADLFILGDIRVETILEEIASTFDYATEMGRLRVGTDQFQSREQLLEHLTQNNMETIKSCSQSIRTRADAIDRVTPNKRVQGYFVKILIKKQNKQDDEQIQSPLPNAISR
eukprot:6168053-Amphidinium_carterae.1